jgi:hypothetical protein
MTSESADQNQNDMVTLKYVGIRRKKSERLVYINKHQNQNWNCLGTLNDIRIRRSESEQYGYIKVRRNKKKKNQSD